MTLATGWQHAFARQAQADFSLWAALEATTVVRSEDCQRLMLLQMSCEKLCKAHLIAQGASPASLQSSHRYIAGPLQVVLRQQFLDEGGRDDRLKRFQTAFRQLANEIEILSPSVDRNGRRPDNCEYPWERGEQVHSPLDQSFAATDLIRAPAGRTILKLIEGAISRLLEQ